MPKITSGKKIVWARTDKSVYMHIFEVSEEFSGCALGNKKQSAEKFRRSNIIKMLCSVKNKKQNAVFLHMLLLIMEYYKDTDTYEKILIRIEQNMQISYYRFINSDSMIVYSFIEKHIGMREKALRDFEAIPLADENLKAKPLDVLTN